MPWLVRLLCVCENNEEGDEDLMIPIPVVFEHEEHWKAFDRQSYNHDGLLDEINAWLRDNDYKGYLLRDLPEAWDNHQTDDLQPVIAPEA